MKNIIRIFCHKLKQPNSRIHFSSIVSLDSFIGEYVNISSKCRIGSSKISKLSYIGMGCVFERTEIGSFCSIGPEVMCGMGTHPLNLISTYPSFYTTKVSGAKSFGIDKGIVDKKNVKIGSDVWIGARAIIIGGITIGHGAVIGAGAVVTKDVEPYSIVGGVPAKHIRYRFDKVTTNLLLESKWCCSPLANLRYAAMINIEPLQFLENLRKQKNTL